MKLSSMRLHNYRCFEDMEIHFNDRLTVLVGPNGSGKTAAIEAVAILLELLPLLVRNSYKDIINMSNVRIGATSADFDYIVSCEEQSHTLAFRYEKKHDSGFFRDIFTRNTNFINTLKILHIPIVVYYSAKRVLNKYTREMAAHADQEYAYKNAFEPHIDFSSTLTWFIEKSSQEALEAVQKKNLEYHIPELEAVRHAVSKALGNYNKPYVGETPPQLFITRQEAPDIPLNLQQLSDGYRTMLALVMDLARRMAVANADRQWPEGENVLHSPGIVLIDEVELHLHPGWQQTVLPRLMDIFPRVQFIVTTHSPQVVSSVDTERVRILGDGDTVYDAPQGIWGAEASRILKRVFGVDNRPPSQARDDLEEYSKLVYANQWDSPRALELRSILDARYGGEEPRLAELDMHIANRKWEMEDGGLGA